MVILRETNREEEEIGSLDLGLSPHSHSQRHDFDPKHIILDLMHIIVWRLGSLLGKTKCRGVKP